MVETQQFPGKTSVNSLYFDVMYYRFHGPGKQSSPFAFTAAFYSLKTSVLLWSPFPSNTIVILSDCLIHLIFHIPNNSHHSPLDSLHGSTSFSTSILQTLKTEHLFWLKVLPREKASSLRPLSIFLLWGKETQTLGTKRQKEVMINPMVTEWQNKKCQYCFSVSDFYD